jgi:MOSC domain-containing protein YiiM
MDEQLPGLTGALDPDWNGGAHGVVIEGGEIAMGDTVTLSEPDGDA